MPYRSTERSASLAEVAALHGVPARAAQTIAVLLMLFFVSLPLSTAVTNTTGALLILVALGLWPKLRARLQVIDQRLVLLVLLVPMTAVTGSAVALANGHTPWKVLGMHRKELLFVALLLVLSVLPLRARLRQMLWAGTGIAIVATTVAWMTGRGFNGGAFNPVEPVSMTHAFHNFIVGTVSLWMLIGALESGQNRAAWQRVCIGALGMLGLFTVFFIVTGRTGQVGVLVMLVVYAVLRLPRRAAVAVAAATLTIAGTLLAVPSAFGDRMRVMKSEVAAYANGEQVTSVGLRFLFWKTSAELIAERPLLGYGTGSYRKVQDARLGVAPMSEKSAPHPHNDLLHFWVERGIAGVVALLGAYVALWHAAGRLGAAEASLLRAVTAGFFVAGLANAFYLDWASGSFLFALYALLLVNADTGRGSVAA
jgi:O-antigen ligase